MTIFNTDSEEKWKASFRCLRYIFMDFSKEDNWIRLLSEKFNIGWTALNIMRKIFHTLPIRPANKADCCVKKFWTFELWEFKVKSRLNFSTEIVFWPIPPPKYFEQGRLVARVNNLTLLKTTKIRYDIVISVSKIIAKFRWKSYLLSDLVD